MAASYGVKTAAYTPSAPLPASATPYVWRVRRIDASGNPGPWSQPGRFTVTADSVTLLSPSLNASVAPNGPVLLWQPVVGAVSYDVAVSPLSGQSTSVSATTVATAYAPQGYLQTGSYRWTAARDAANAQIGQAQSTFVVDAQIMALQAPSIESPGGTGVGKTLSVTAPQWNMTGVETTYQWLRNGEPIYGATGATYVLTTDDFGTPGHGAGDRTQGRVPRRGLDQPARRRDLRGRGQQPDASHHHRQPHGGQLPERQRGHLVRRLGHHDQRRVAA